MSKRVVAVVVAAVLAGAAGFYVLSSEELVPRDAPTLNEMARSVGAPIMLHLHRGHVPGRSGEIMLVPKPHHYLVSEWDLRTLGTDEPEIRTTHPNPWDFLTRVPIAVFGAGLTDAGTTSDVPADIAQIAPTYARVLGLDDFESTACSLEEVIACDHEGGIEDPPRLIFTVVVDGGGWNLLDAYPDSWPHMRRIMDRGVTYTNATIGSSPSTTGALHATFGTGSFPRDHGIPGNLLRGDDGEIVDVFLDEANDTRYLQGVTVSEVWDETNGNRPTVATVSYENWHLGMIGHGAQRDEGDRDVAVLWHREQGRWYVNESFYELPAYLQPTDKKRLARYEEEMAAADGSDDGAWFGHPLDEIRKDKNQRPSTPAFARLTGDAVLDVIRNERLGEGDLTDLMWVEMKMPDSAGHAWNMVNREVAAVLEETDRQIGRFVEVLDRLLGRDRYLFALSADHGQQPLAEATGGWRINTSELERDVVARFGDVVDQASPADLYLDTDALRREGVTATDIARWIATYTLGENIPDGAPGAEKVPRERLDDELFAGAFPTDYLARPASFEDVTGTGDYDEGDFPATFPARK